MTINYFSQNFPTKKFIRFYCHKLTFLPKLLFLSPSNFLSIDILFTKNIFLNNFSRNSYLSIRFSALYRTYKYFFVKGNLDIELMRSSCRKFIGPHDFRNFCKMDPTITNFMRDITSFSIDPVDESYVFYISINNSKIFLNISNFFFLKYNKFLKN